jgi:predicted transcriptional regulator
MKVNMNEDFQHAALLEYFKALSDANRLKIVGFLAQRPYAVGELAEVLGLSISTTSNHLSHLSYAGLVSARAKGHYSIYSLETRVLQDIARSLLQTDNLPRLSHPEASATYERRVLDTFTDPEGRITAFPAQGKKFLVLLRYVLLSFEPGVHYTEKQVNEILLRFNKDTASLRRGMIEYHLMERVGGGGTYWRPAYSNV